MASLGDARRLFLGLVLLFLCLWPAPARAGAPVVAAVSVAALPHDPEAFTQGLLYHDGVFYESTGLYGHSSLRRVAPAAGRILARRDLPRQFFAEGLALLDGKLYQLTWREGRVLVFQASDLRPVGEFPLATEGWGISVLGGRLVVSDGTDRLAFYDPRDFTRLGELAVTDGGKPVSLLNELEVISGAIWANVLGGRRIAVIDPASGRVLAWVDCSALAAGVSAINPENVLNGIAADPSTGRIWVTGKRWPSIHEIKVPGLPAGAGR